MAEPLLACEGLTIRFGGLVALSGLDLKIDRGEFVGVIGPNGAGKTTFFNAISGLAPPASGKLRFAGEDLTGKAAYTYARKGIARTFQTPRVFGRLSVLENVLFAIEFATRDRERADATAILRRLEMDGEADRPAASLPPARQRLLEIAMALGTHPRLLLLDEVAAGLTEAEVAQIAVLIRSIRDELGAAVIWIEHAVGALLRTVERVVVLHHGLKIADDPPAEVSSDPRVLEAYLGAEGAA